MKRPVEPVITPDELCFLICSVCAGLSGIGLGSAFRAPSGSALTLIAADAVLLAKEVEEEEKAAQARARGSDRISIDHSHYNGGEGVAATGAITKPIFRLWLTRCPLAILCLERLALLPRLRVAIQRLGTLVSSSQAVVARTLPRLIRLSSAPAPRGTQRSRRRTFDRRSKFGAATGGAAANGPTSTKPVPLTMVVARVSHDEVGSSWHFTGRRCR